MHFDIPYNLQITPDRVHHSCRHQVGRLRINHNGAGTNCDALDPKKLFTSDAKNTKMEEKMTMAK